jgi:hypothetical protein
MTNPPLRAAVYARFSTDLQRDTSIEDQLRACHEFAARQGLQVVGQYSARDIHRTPLRERLRSVSKPAMAFFRVYERRGALVGGAVAPRASFLAGPCGGQPPLAHDNVPPAGVFGFTGGADAGQLRTRPVQGRDPGPEHRPERCRG